MIVILDANIWLKQLALNSGLGAALRFHLHQRGAKLGLPEVVKIEVQENLRRALFDNIAQIERSSRELLTVFGSLKEITPPSHAEVEAVIETVFGKVGVDVIEIPFSLESARSSLWKVVRKEPPSANSEEFRDGIIWADCCKALETDDVYFATQDKAFFKNRNYSDGMAENLKKETEGKRFKFQLTHDIANILDQIKADVSVDRKSFAGDALAKAHTQFLGEVSAQGFTLSDSLEMTLYFYVTEDPARLFFQYVIIAPCEDVTGGGRRNGRAIFKGNGLFDPHAKLIVECNPGQEALRFDDVDGNKVKGKSIVYASGSMTLGRRTITHTVRNALSASITDLQRLYDEA
jgi:hypothetical protein